VLGELVQTTAGKWITHPPTHCPNGGNLGPNQVLAGHQACLGHGGGHTACRCHRCETTVYGPPLNHRATLDGPATARISSARDWRRKRRRATGKLDGGLLAHTDTAATVFTCNAEAIDRLDPFRG